MCPIDEARTASKRVTRRELLGGDLLTGFWLCRKKVDGEPRAHLRGRTVECLKNGLHLYPVSAHRSDTPP